MTTATHVTKPGVFTGSPFTMGTREGSDQIRCLDDIKSQADRVLSGELFLPASGPFGAGRDIRWNRDYLSGSEWPLQPAKDLQPGAIPGSDIRIVWEINRLQQLPLLGLAGIISNDSRYYQHFRRTLTHWIETNPEGMGPNWMSPMESAIRAINILVSLSLFERDLDQDHSFQARVNDSLHQHGRFIAANLEVRRTPSGRLANNNHYLSNLLGMLYLGACFRKDAAGRKWLALAKKKFQKEFIRQMHPEGSNFESSLCYHQLVTEMGVLGAVMLLRLGQRLRSSFISRLHNAINLMDSAWQPDGSLPRFGDSDDGRVLPLSRYFEAPMSMRQKWLGHFHSLFKGEVPSQSTDDRYLFQDLIDSGRLPLKAEVVESATDGAFPHAGWYFYRGGFNFLAASAGEVGTALTGNHKHNDLLSFVFWKNGQEILTDPGTACYTRDPERRQHFRSTLAHNTITVNGAEQNRFIPGVLFAMLPDAFPVPVLWCREGKQVSFRGRHTGFHRLSPPVDHLRHLIYLEEENILLVCDTLRAVNNTQQSFEYISSFHFSELFQGVTPEAIAEPPALTPERIEAWTGQIPGQHVSTFQLVSEQADLSVGVSCWCTQPVTMGWEDDTLSPAFGHEIAALTLRLKGKGTSMVSTIMGLQF